MKDSLMYTLLDFFHEYLMFNMDKFLPKLGSIRELLEEIIHEELSKSEIDIPSTTASIRLYTEEESYKLNTECRNLVYFLENREVLDNNLREILIEQVMEREHPITVAQFKQLILFVLSMESERDVSWLNVLFEQETCGWH